MLITFAYSLQIAFSQTGVLTQHNNLNRTGWYSTETILNTKNVKPGSFGKIFTRSVDDQIYAQPLVMLNVTILGEGIKNAVFVATVNNTLYAFDADSANVTTPYWQVSLTPKGSRAVKNTDMTYACGGFYRDFSGNIGIAGTPVIDSATNTLYVVARSVDVATGTIFQQYLHAIDITNGNEKNHSPKLIIAQVAGNGDGSQGGIINFDSQKQNQRCGLLLVNNNVYITYASHCDWGPYHGWILGYNKNTLQQTRVYNSTPEGYNGGIWMSGAAPAADESGNIYVGVGNGSVGNNGNASDIINRSESALKLVPSGSGFTISSFFTPQNINELEASDLDFGVTGILLIPNTNRAVTSCKDGHIYLLDRDNMGDYNANTNNVVQTIDLGINAHLRSSLAYYKGEQKEFVYSWSENALLKAFPYNRTTGQFELANTISSGVQGPTGSNGALLAISSNGSLDSTAILWTSYARTGDANQSVRPGILRAFDANDVIKELWNSSQYSTDDPGNYAKFDCPTIANGKVYLATFSNQLVVYGLTGSAPDSCNSNNIALDKTAVASSVESISYAAANAFDGNPNTRWSSEFSDPQYIYVDLGKRYDLCKVVLRWEAAYGKDFTIQTSDDTNTWTDVLTVTGNTSAENYLSVKGSGRYVRMYGTQRGTSYGYSLWEFEVYGKESVYSCAAPSDLSVTNIYEGSATLHWSSNGASGFVIQYKTVSAESWNTTTSDTNFITLTALACGTDYLFRVKGVCSGNDSSNYSQSSSLSTLSCSANCSPLPTRWTTQDIGDIGVAGSACFENGIFTLSGSGNDIWDTQDAFRFAYKTLVGDGIITARVLTQDATNEWNKCGIMFRESLTPNSRNVFIALTSGNGAAFQNRLITDDYSNNINTGAGIQAPYWLRLVKNGSVYTAFISSDSIVWTQLGDAVDAGFGNGIPVYAGLAITSHDNTVLSTAAIDNYFLSGELQLQLINFTASLTLNQTVELKWVTTLETNIRDFIVERSADNKNFSDIDTVPAVNNGRFTQNYTDEDKSPLQGFNYYRLRITDADGKITYSAPAFVRVTNSKAPILYPNPATGLVNIAQGAEAIKLINIYDVSGRLMKSLGNISANPISIATNTFADGIYFVEIRTATSVYREKLVVHN
ncbi:MAG: discoidin domain-containing protein [Parafilimonas sp.]